MSRVSADDRAGDGHREERPGNGSKNDVSHKAAARQQEKSAGEPPQNEQQDQHQDPKQRDEQDEPKKPPIYKRPAFWIAIGVLAVIGLIVFLLWFFDWRYHITTDDAFITAHSTTVSPRVSGHVEKVLVDDNQSVKKGDALLVLDQRDFVQAVKSAEASEQSAPRPSLRRPMRSLRRPMRPWRIGEGRCRVRRGQRQAGAGRPGALSQRAKSRSARGIAAAGGSG